MANHSRPTMRTPLGQVRHLGSAKSGTLHFWRQRLSAVADVPLTIAAIAIIMSLFGRNHAGVVKILGSPLIAIIMLLFMFTSVYHMWLGMQVIIEDYVHEEWLKFLALMSNTFFCFAVGITVVFAIFNLSFGV
jgi:succinate dehydrogenase / fumarate reductase, membrane anchor subunit